MVPPWCSPEQIALPKVKLTEAVVKAAVLPDTTTELTIWDTDVTGFGLRLRKGARTYILAYRPAGAGRTAATRRLKLGTPETIRTPGEARTLARIALGRVASGGDPHAERQEQKRRHKAKVADLLDRYQVALIQRKYVNATVVINGLKTRLKAHLNQDIREVAGSEYAAIIEAIRRAGLKGAAADFRSRCSAFLAWCVATPKVIETNPLTNYRKQRATRADRLKTGQPGRALSDDELHKVWKAADPATTFGRYIRCLILTGCRRGEAAGMNRSMIDAKERLVRLPPAFVKQGRGHDIPITPELQEIFDLCQIDSSGDLIFASPKTGGQMSGWVNLVAKLTKSSGVDFTLHDLRRTFRTGLSRLGVSPEIAELAIGHARQELEQIYNRDRAGDELRCAFTLWADHVAKICNSFE